MIKSIFTLNIFIFFMIFSSSSCILESHHNADTCIFDTDCDANAFCVENKCQEYVICDYTYQCAENENCIDNKCKIRACISNEDCGVNEYCLDDFRCVYIPKNGTGSNCNMYGNLECESNQCIADEFRFFCTKDCEFDTECPDYMFCGSFYEDKKSCIYKDSGEGDHQGGYGSNCEINGQTDCMDFYTCVKNINDRNEDRCLMDCVTSNDCYQGYECLRHSDNNYYCIPPSNKTTGELCNQFNGLECQNADDSCIKIADGYEKFCTKECELDIDCTNGTTCKEFNDKKYCMYNPTSNLGETCADNGNEQCKDDLICDFNYSRGPICTKECLSDLECSAYNSCSITYNNEKLCRPAINGLGDRTGELASECYEHGDSDCKEDFLCLSSSIDDKDAFCTKHCETNDECGENFHCANTTKTGSKLCVKGMVGELGSNCYNESCNQGLFCNFSQLNDYTATCTRTCDSIGEECSEKSGFYCNKIYDNFNLCLNQAPENIGNLGDKCPNGKCIEGLNCIYDIEGNFCSQPCDNEINICPENFACLQYDEIHNFCYLE